MAGMGTGEGSKYKYTNTQIQIGELDQSGSYTGEAAYLYPDLSTAIVGMFKEGRLVTGREARLVGLDCEEGLLRPR